MKMSKSNFIFFGTPEVASKTLQILKENGFLPSLIITSPDRPQGRKMIITPPPVKMWAIENNIPYLQPEDLRGGRNVVFESVAETGKPSMANFQQKIMRDFKNNIPPELAIIVAYGKIIPENIINMPKLGSINIHYSLLPKYRGASPVESAILNSEIKTGVSIQQMEYKMDSGAVLACEETNILPDETTPELRKRLIQIGGELLVKILPKILNGKIKAIPQKEEDATFCKKIKKSDGEINLKNEPIKNYNKFRAYAEWPRTFFFENGKRIIITDALLEDGYFSIKRVLPESKKEIAYQEFLKTRKTNTWT